MFNLLVLRFTNRTSSSLLQTYKQERFKVHFYIRGYDSTLEHPPQTQYRHLGSTYSTRGGVPLVTPERDSSTFQVNKFSRTVKGWRTMAKERGQRSENEGETGTLCVRG